MACAMKIHLKKNAAANGLELKERLQGLTATDVTHSRKSKATILIFHIWPHKHCENPPSQITKHRLLIKSRNKTGISTPSDLHSLVASLCFYSNSSYFFSSFFSAVSTFFPISDMTSDDTWWYLMSSIYKSVVYSIYRLTFGLWNKSSSHSKQKIMAQENSPDKEKRQGRTKKPEKPYCGTNWRASAGT